ncbi:hypothetical protein Zmor_003112 [Zophobas morio]|uniref:EB domain-containing protein n=1 Tax=Zophobas morio TaxID=2755281 RepID=A0AA38M104_9CUCU|nr:hypothetical protein Zmor_003112 [Zophobas morio]
MVSNKVLLLITAVVGLATFSLADSSCNGDDSCKLKDLPYVTEYYGECSDNSQCEWLGENSECNYVCRCKEGYRWYLGKCNKFVGLGEECSDSLDCYDGYNLQSLTCLSGTCECTNGYYRRNDTDCRKIASNVTDTCALDIDCQVNGVETVCVLGKCLPPEESGSEEYLEQVEERFFSFRVDETTCTEDADCKAINNSYCYDKTNTCICQPQYFFNDDGTTCIPELGVEAGCTEDSDCVIKPGKCEDGVCYCRDYYFTAEGNRKCVKTISQNNWNCLSKEWCYALGPYSYCESAGVCNCSKISDYDEKNNLCLWNGENDPDMCTNDLECKYIQNGYCVDELCGCRKGYALQDNRCVPDLGSQCDGETVICEIKNSECRDNICQCIEKYVALEDKACYLQSTQLGDPCEVDIQCSATVLYSKCMDTTCGCDDDHLAFNETCYAKREYGSHCTNLLECTLSLGDSIQCRKGVCQCPTGETLDGNTCSSGSFITGNVLILVVVWLAKETT